LFLVLLVDGLIVVPALAYLVEGRRYRREMILAYFSPDIICDYFRQFWSGNSRFSELIDKYKAAYSEARISGGTDQQKEARANDKRAAEVELIDQFRGLYDDRFGALKYFLPFVALTLVLFIESKFVIEFVDLLMVQNAHKLTEQTVADGLLKSLVRLPDQVAVAAMIGAYLAIGLDLLRRVSSLVLLPGDLWFYALRLVIAPMLGYAVGSFADGKASVLAAFTIAFLPLGDILLWLRARTAKAAGIEDRPEEARDKPIKLPGVDSNVAARLEDQGVNTIMQLCEVDPVLLSMRTGFDFTYVVRLVDEAIAWRYLGDKLPLLNVCGWTGASSMLMRVPSDGEEPFANAEHGYQQAFLAWQAAKNASETVKPPDPKLVEAEGAAKSRLDTARKTLKEAAQYQANKELVQEIAKQDNKFGLAPVGIGNVLRQINEDGYAKFIDGLLKASARNTAPKKPETFWGRLMGLFGSTGS
jgi:hypothetical protein